MEVISISFKTAYFLHLLLDEGKGRVKGKGSDPSNHIKTREGNWPTPTSKTGHLSKLKPELPINCAGTMGAESM